MIRSFCSAFLLLSLAIAASPAAIAARGPNGDIRNGEDLPRFPLGEWVEANGPEQLYEFELEAGTAVEVRLGARATPFNVTVYGPTALEYSRKPPNDAPRVPSDIYSIATLPGSDPVEFVAIAAKSPGKYVIRLSPLAPSKWSVFLSRPRPAGASDYDSTEAARQMAVILASRRGIPIDKVMEASKRRVESYTRIGHQRSLALALMTHSGVQSSAGDIRDAIGTMLEARSIYLVINEIERAIDSSPCYLYEALGEFDAWINCGREMVSLSRRYELKAKEAQALRVLGGIYHNIADEPRAKDCYESALAIWRLLATDSRSTVAEQIQSLIDLGNLKFGVMNLGRKIEFFPKRSEEDYKQAIKYYTEARELITFHRAAGGPFILQMLGSVNTDLGRFDEAERYLNDAFKGYSRLPGSQALVMAELARMHVRKGDHEKAAALIDSAISDLRKLNSKLRRLADLYLDAGQPEKARAIYSEALESARKTDNRSDIPLALYGLARAERKLGNFNNARLYIIEAIEIADSLRNRIVDDEIRSIYFAAVKTFYDFYIDLLMQAHKSQPEKQYDRLALEISEKARARNLMDLLKMSGVDIRQGVDAELLTREKELKSRLAEKASRYNRVMLARHTPDEAEKAQRDVNEASEALAKAEAEIKQRSPRYASITQPSAVTVKEMQELLDSGTLMLQYILGERRSYLWVVSRESVHSFELPSGEEINKQVSAVYAAVTARNQVGPGETERLKTKRVKAADEEYSLNAATLSSTLLSPAADLVGSKRLVIVPDGSLNYISFAALPSPRYPAMGQTPSVLAHSHEIVTLPSALSLSLLREEANGRSTAKKMVAVFADPVFSGTDARAGGQARLAKPVRSSPGVGLRDLDLAASSVGLANGLPRLPFSRREADAITSRVKRDLTAKYIDFGANKETVFVSGLDQYRIVHFATHGFLDSKNPALSGMVLSLVDKTGADIDGFLRLQDVFNLKLNADLVVLSACNTALGKEVRGEGLVGLTRGFMYAGSPRVVASLWKVDDAATANFMAIFYRKMLVDNLRPAAALRAAQVEMMKQPRWRSPYYWAPFVLQGEWR
jgi:CHAT domain-containing protein